jgi:hypothetical protein
VEIAVNAVCTSVAACPSEARAADPLSITVRLPMDPKLAAKTSIRFNTRIRPAGPLTGFYEMI